MNKLCVKNCTFFNGTSCSLYEKELTVEHEVPFKCKECLKEEREWALKQTAKDIVYGSF